jgi:hypothetical protein
MGINYVLFIWFDEDFLMHSLRKYLSEIQIALLCNFYRFWHKNVQKGEGGGDW